MDFDETPRRICLFLDGTWDDIDSNTNVWRLYSMCSKETKIDKKRQITYYTKGVGTTFLTHLTGGATGSGINEMIIAAYEWLIQNYRENDDLFIFGFSRGAYAARSLAGLIATQGIIKPGSPIGVGELYDRYKLESARTIYHLHDDQRDGKLGETTILENWLLEHSILAPILMVGVWDTVGALVGRYSFLATGLRSPLKNAYHALSIDEHRKTFSPTLYTQNFYSDAKAGEVHVLRDISSVEQRWFVGTHGNVGGGYNSDLLVQLPLAWIKRKAEAHGLEFDFHLNESDESNLAKIQDSFKQMAYGLYYVVRFGVEYYREIGSAPIVKGSKTTVTVNETIDASVFDRMRKSADYRPRNILNWASHHKVDPLKILNTVRADAPSVAVD